MSELPPKVLYKYMPSERSSFFLKPKLRFSPPPSLNDIFDCALIYDEFISFSYAGSVLSRYNLDNDNINQQKLKQAISVEAIEYIEKIKNDLSKIGILSLTNSIENEAMWGLYATNEKKTAHTGFAIGLKTSHPFFTRQEGTTVFWRLIKVKYTQGIKPPCLSDYFGKDINSFLLEYLFKKGDKWEFENEWRMATAPSIVPSNEISGLVEIDVDMISGVYLGIMADTSLSYRAKLFCDSFDIPLFQMQCNRQARTLIPVPLLTAS